MLASFVFLVLYFPLTSQNPDLSRANKPPRKRKGPSNSRAFAGPADSELCPESTERLLFFSRGFFLFLLVGLAGSRHSDGVEQGAALDAVAANRKGQDFVGTLAGTGFAAAARLGLGWIGCSAVAAAGGVLVCFAVLVGGWM
ncbi:hypothetical protein J3F84DRAFT_358010 [Trichoderma pleuroticola]